MKHILAIFLALLLVCPVFSDEVTGHSFVNPDHLNLYSIDLPIIKRDEDNLLSQVTFNNNVCGSVKAKYVGFYGIITGEAEKRLKRYSRRQTRIMFNNSNMSFAEAGARMAALGQKHNPYGDWWDRSWFHSLPPEKGGASLKQTEVQIGQEFNAPNWQIVNWGKHQIERLGDVWLTNDQAYEGTEDGDVLTVPGEQPIQSNGKRLNKYNGRDEADVVIDQTPWFLGDFYHFRFKPSLRIRGGPNIDDMIDELSLRFVVELYTSDKLRNHFGNVSFFARYNIPDNEYLTSITFDLVTW
tara:strand:- start:3341 stop:4231 length:891 start_codon:yes stop_codon:yes gene_type:complete